MNEEAIRQSAFALGFDSCRFTRADPPESAAHFHEWLEAGWHGEMNYLQRNAPKRVAPQQVLAGARSIVCLAASYHREEPAGQVVEGPVSSSNSHAAVGAAPPSAVIARYARFTDYHDVLGERLKKLSLLLTELGGTDTRSLWYVDTGPFLERDLAQRAGLGFIG